MDLIERQDAIDAIKKCRNESYMPDMWYDGMSCALRCIYQLSSSQSKSYREGYQAGFKDAQPEIIRCRECKHYTFADNRAFGFPAKRCEWTGFEDVDDDDFCSRAERREDNK